MKVPIIKVYAGEKKTDISEFVESFKFEDVIEKDDFAQFKISPKITDVYDLDKIIKAGVIIRFQFGYLGGAMSVIHKARISDIAIKYGINISIDVKALDLGSLLRKDSSNTVWKDMTTKEIVSNIAKKHGLKYECDIESEKWNNLPQGHLDSFEFLKQLTQKQDDGNSIVTVTGDTLKVVRRGLNKHSSRTFTYGNPNDIVISFESKVEKSKGKDGVSIAGEGTTANTDSDSQKNAISLVIDANKGKQIGKMQGGQILKEVEGVTTNFMSGVKSFFSPEKEKPKVESKSNAISKKSELKELTGTLVLLGLPTIVCNGIITLQGVLKRDIGNWYIAKVVHDISSNGYKTTLELSRSKQGTGKTTNATKGDTDAKDAATTKLRVYKDGGTQVAVNESEVYKAPIPQKGGFLNNGISVKVGK